MSDGLVCFELLLTCKPFHWGTIQGGEQMSAESSHTAAMYAPAIDGDLLREFEVNIWLEGNFEVDISQERLEREVYIEVP